MLLRNHKGDWCIVKAHWVSETTPGFGKVQIVIYDLESRAVSRYTIRDDEMQTIKLDHVTIDMPTGRITLGTSCENTAENIALAFCIGMLFLTCQRKAVMTSAMAGSVRSLNQSKYNMDDAMTSSDTTSGQGSVRNNNTKQQGPVSRFGAKVKLQQRKRTRRRKMSASFTFLLACGLQIESYYHSISQPASRNGTLTRAETAPTIINREGDIQFGDITKVNGVGPNGTIRRVNHNDVPPPPDDNYMDIHL